MKKKPDDEALNLDAASSAELNRVVTSQQLPNLQDSAVIPNIEDWLKGRCRTNAREILKNGFDDKSFQ